MPEWGNYEIDYKNVAPRFVFSSAMELFGRRRYDTNVALPHLTNS